LLRSGHKVNKALITSSAPAQFGTQRGGLIGKLFAFIEKTQQQQQQQQQQW